MRFRAALIVVACFGFLPRVSHGFGVKTHRRVIQMAVRTAAPGGFQLDDFLRRGLGPDFIAGIATPLGGHTVEEWLEEGGEREDESTPVPMGQLPGRFNRHFHDPLRSWDDAGLQPVSLGPRFDSSVVWMQLDDGVDAGTIPWGYAGQGWSWPDARRAYYHALTWRYLNDRNQKWADTFRGIGQVMHLVADAGQPQHTRNDPHPFGYFESWVDQHLGDGSFSLDPSAANTRFDRNILYQPTGHAEALVSIANLIDTDLYECNPPPLLGSRCDPNLTLGPTIGIAEFTNANFFTEGTVPGPYPYPDVTRVKPSENTATRTALGYRRHYYRKGDGDGIALDPAMVERVYDQLFEQGGAVGVEEVLVDRTTDKYVWGAMAKILVPKAVDYAQGVLEYFFRGRFDFCHGGRGGFSAIRNTGPEALHGVFQLYYDDSAGVRQKVGEWRTDDYLPLNVGGWLFPGDVLRVPDGDVPTDSAPISYTLVFHGDMGSEIKDQNNPASLGAVAAKVIDASQQCPQTLWQWNDGGTAIVAYDVGPDGVPSRVNGSISPPLTAGSYPTGWGVAFDPTDGNLWYTSTAQPVDASDGILRKTTPDGATVTGIQVVGTLVEEDSGVPQTDFSAIDMDPDDPHFIWVSGWGSFHYNYVALYKVRTSDGQVVHSCVAHRWDDEPSGTSGANLLLAAVKLGGATVLLAAPDQAWQGNRVFGFDAETCAGVGMWDFLPLPDPEFWVGAPSGIAMNGAGEWITAIWMAHGQATSFYRFAPGPFGYAVLDNPLATGPTFAG